MAFTNDPNQFEDFKEDEYFEQPMTPPEGGGNRNFITGIIIVAVLFVLAVGGLIAYVLLFQGPSRQAANATAAAVYAQNTLIAIDATNQAGTAFFLLTPSATLTLAATPLPSNTPVLVVATATPEPQNTETVLAPGSPEERTATVAAFLTQVAAGGTETTPGTPTSTALPSTGFADEVGFPALLGLALALVAVIIFARRLRLSPRS